MLTCTNCGIQYLGERITVLNLRMNFHRRGQPRCEISINHYRNVCKNAAFSIQVIEKLPGNGYEKGIKDRAMLEHRLQREDYCMKTLRTVYPYGLNERTKFMNEDIRLFPPLPRYGERFIDTRTQSKITNHDLSPDTEIFFKIF